MKINRCPKCGQLPGVTTYGIDWDGGRQEEEEHVIECLFCELATAKCKTLDDAVTKWNELTKGEDND